MFMNRNDLIASRAGLSPEADVESRKSIDAHLPRAAFVPRFPTLDYDPDTHVLRITSNHQLILTHRALVGMFGQEHPLTAKTEDALNGLSHDDPTELIMYEGRSETEAVVAAWRLVAERYKPEGSDWDSAQAHYLLGLIEATESSRNVEGLITV